MYQKVLEPGFDYVIVDHTPLQQSSATLRSLVDEEISMQGSNMDADCASRQPRQSTTDLRSINARMYQTTLKWTNGGLAIKRKYGKSSVEAGEVRQY